MVDDAPPNVARRETATGNLFREQPSPTKNSRKDTILETWHLFLRLRPHDVIFMRLIACDMGLAVSFMV